MRAQLAPFCLAFDAEVPLERRQALSVLARECGLALADGSRDGDHGPTHIIAESGDLARLSTRNAIDLRRGAKLVLPAWLEAAHRLHLVYPVERYSPDNTHFLAGTIICTTGVRPHPACPRSRFSSLPIKIGWCSASSRLSAGNIDPRSLARTRFCSRLRTPATSTSAPSATAQTSESRSSPRTGLSEPAAWAHSSSQALRQPR